MRYFHDIRWREAIRQPTRSAFVTLYTLESMSRALLVTVIPIAAYDLLADAQLVSALFFGAAVVGLSSSFLVPWLVRRITRRGTVSLGCLVGVAAMIGFASQSPIGFAVGMCLSLFAGACLEIGISTFLLDTLPRREMGRFEPLRILFLGASWTIGPFGGVLLRSEVDPIAPFDVNAALFLMLLVAFWVLAFKEQPRKSTAGKSSNPLKFVKRFVSSS